MELTTCPVCSGLVETYDGEFPPHTRPDSNARCRGTWQPVWLVDLRPQLQEIAAAASTDLGGRDLDLWIDEDWQVVVCRTDCQRDDTRAIFDVLRAMLGAYGYPGEQTLTIQNFGPEGPGASGS